MRVVSYKSDRKNHVVVYDWWENHAVEDVDLRKRNWHYAKDPWSYIRANNPFGPQSYVGSVILLDPNGSSWPEHIFLLVQLLFPVHSGWYGRTRQCNLASHPMRYLAICTGTYLIEPLYLDKVGCTIVIYKFIHVITNEEGDVGVWSAFDRRSTLLATFSLLDR